MSKLTHQIQEALLQNRPILHEKETWYTTKELQWEMTKVQDYLITAGVSKGDRVLVGLPNSYQFISIFLGIINYGAVVVPMNPNMPEIEFLSFIERSKPVFGFIKPEYTNFLLKEEVKRSPLDSFCRVDYDGYTFFDFKELNKPFQREANIGEDSIAILLYTSGTTGIPKAVGLTHEQILETATNIIMSHELKSMDTTYCFLPLFHINAQVVAVLSTILSHGKIVLDEKFSATKFWKVLSEFQITWVSAVPAIISILLEKPQPSEIPTHVRFIRSASAQLPMIHAKRFEQRFGIALIQSYGMTEAASQICVNPLPPKKRVLGSVGRPVGLQLQIVDSNGRKVPTNKVGEITIRGKNVITSYVEALNQNDFRNGWFHTGDLGFMDQEGFVFIVGRIKEMINRGGEKISPYEVEDVIRQLPMIKEAAVIGIPHHLYGEEIVAYIRQKQHDHNDELEQLVMNHCERNLTSFKCPAKVVIVEDLPHGPTGKVQRNRLKEISLEYFSKSPAFKYEIKIDRLCIHLKMNKKYLMILGSLLLVCFMTIGCSNQSNNETEEEKVVRIGYQKNGPLFIVKSRGTLEESLKELGFTVEWKEFQDGPSLLEALNAGSIDFGRTGNTPPIFSQAAGSKLTYVAAGFSKYEGSGILVKNDSTITSLADLKGKKIAFSKGSSSHYLLVKTLESVGLSLDDIQPAYLTPGNARIAFEQDQVDAWVVWDPYTSSTEVNANAKLLVNGEGLTTDRDFFVSTEDFATNQEELLNTVLNEVSVSMDWANTHHEELIELLATELKMDEASVTLAVERRVYGVEDINDEILKEQQEMADLFYELEIIPNEIKVNEAVKQ